MRTLTIAALAAATLFAAAPANAESCTTFGSSTYCSNGQSFTQYGDTIYDNQGNSWTQYGNTLYGSDGSSYTQYGDTRDLVQPVWLDLVL